MTEATTTKFNLPKTTTYIIMPLAFTGKDKRFSGFTNACQFLLAEIYTANNAVKAPAKLTYEHLVQKFGMSRETVSKGLKELKTRKIIEEVAPSRYRFLLKFKKSDYIVIDDYLHKKLWNVGDKLKRLARSRIKTFGFLQRMNENPQTDKRFVSSQARIGKAINLPRTTAGESVRELVRAGMVHTESVGGLHCLTRYVVDSGFNLVKRQAESPTATEIEAVKNLFKPTPVSTEPAQSAEPEPNVEAKDERRAGELQRKLLRDVEYAELYGRLKELKARHVQAIIKRDVLLQSQAEDELKDVGERIKAYLKAHDVPDVFPGGYFYIF